ncbi:chemotaxis protein CheB [Sphingobacterium pedocola]|uniref:protein-glutamate methylesterase n=1 Tax=Sphingobacterium pedocola TaxID=2082722 RepID=A0ABR9TCP6_9SPHI|nr:chemotaxis protein CheB [Sphingobacterium pedocola]MBE8723040.1 chemotaxis protein CheB [Sphingobacterium pedocola]
MKDTEINNIITIGASAGGLSAVSDLLSSLPKDIDAAIFIVIHLSKGANPETVLSMLNRNSKLSVQIPKDGTSIQNGIVYVAPSDAHMMLRPGLISIKKGPMENHWRPAIDVLFRTAAAAYDSCVTGIILTGLLDDGTSGMTAIKSAGGTCIVQEPEEAEFPDMPNNVINNIEVDYRVPLIDIRYILEDIYTRGTCKPSQVPEHIKQESDITIRMASSYEQTKQLGTPTALTCPDCGGVLTKIEEDDVTRYRCFTGHVFSERFLEEQYMNKTEETLWVAIRMMEERRNFISNTAGYANEHPILHVERTKRAAELKLHIDHLKEILTHLGKPVE